MSVTYYHIKDLNVLAKEEDYVPYLFVSGKGWVVDDDNVLMDRIMGYDSSEPADSPYKMGSTDVMESVKEISEKEADKMIANL